MVEEIYDEFKKYAKIGRPPKSILNEFKKLNASLVSDALWSGFGMNTYLEGLSHMFDFMENKVYVGTAITVKELSTTKEPIGIVQKKFQETGKSRIDHALAAMDFSESGDILVIDGEGLGNVALFGGIMATLSKRAGITAAVLNGGLRDLVEIRELQLPVFAKGVSPIGSLYFLETTGFNIPVTCGGVQVRPGDIIVGDEDGVVSVPKEYAKKVLEKAWEIVEKEKISQEAIKSSRYALESYPPGRPKILEELRKKVENKKKQSVNR